MWQPLAYQPVRVIQSGHAYLYVVVNSVELEAIDDGGPDADELRFKCVKYPGQTTLTTKDRMATHRYNDFPEPEMRMLVVAKFQDTAKLTAEQASVNGEYCLFSWRALFSLLKASYQPGSMHLTQPQKALGVLAQQDRAQCNYWLNLLKVALRNKTYAEDLLDNIRCNQCSLYFNSNYRLYRHKQSKSHSNNTEKYVCYICEKTFTRWDHRNKHLHSVHFRQKEYPCDMILRKDKDGLKKGEKCEAVFFCQEDLVNHQHSYLHTEPAASKYKCNVCEKVCSKNTHLRRHMEKQHQKTKEEIDILLDGAGLKLRGRGNDLIEKRRHDADESQKTLGVLALGGPSTSAAFFEPITAKKPRVETVIQIDGDEPCTSAAAVPTKKVLAEIQIDDD